MRKQVSDDYKPVAFWSFNDQLEKEELTRQLGLLQKAGYSGGFLHSRVGLVTEYMSSEWMDIAKHCCEDAKQSGAHLWLYDEDRFPSGYAGGAVLEVNDNLRAKALCLIEEGEIEKFTVLKQYKEVSHEGKDYIIALCSAKDGNPNFEGKCYVDLLDRETTDVFIQQTHEKYLKSIGEYFGKEVKGLFSDEFCYTQKASFPCFSVPFTVDLERDFEEKCGYDLTACMELLFFDYEGYRKVRRDFYEYLTRRFIDNFTKPYNEWCKEHNLIFTGHLLHEDFLTTQPEWTGAVMPHYVHMGMPGIDVLGSDMKYLMTAKQLTSVAEQMGTRSLCEGFGCSGHQFGPSEIKRVADWLCVLGVNFMTPHLTLYSSRGERKRDYPPDFSWRQPWFEVGTDCFDHVSRVSELLDKENVHTDLLVIHPVQSVWAEYSPLHKPNPVFSIWAPKNENAGQNFITETECYQKPFFDLSKQLMEFGLNYHYGDEMILGEHGQYDDGVVIGKCKYQRVIVPPVNVLQESTIQFLYQTAKEFGKTSVVFIKEFPDCIPEEMRDVFTLVKDVKAAVLHMQKEVVRPVEIRDAYSGQIADKIYYRYCEDGEGNKVVFLANISEKRGYDLKVFLPFEQAPAVIDTVTGEYHKAPGSMTERGYLCELSLGVSGSAMFVSEKCDELSVAGMLQSGAHFKTTYQRVQTIANPEYKVCNVNVLPLNVVNYKAAGREFKNRPVEGIWYTAFYNLPNGTEFEAEYKFHVSELPEGPVTALIEVARNLEEIEVNGVSVAITAWGSNQKYFDQSFDSIVLENLKPGENSIYIRGKKCSNITGIGCHTRVAMGTEHKPTELESIYLCGNFGVAPSGNGDYEIVKAPKTVKGSVVKSFYPFYVGRCSYSFQLTQSVDAMRIDADAHAVELKINGERKAISYLKPFVFEQLGDCAGEAEIILYNSQENTFGPLHLAERKDFVMIGPVYFPDMKRYVKQPYLFDYGLYALNLLKSIDTNCAK